MVALVYAKEVQAPFGLSAIEDACEVFQGKYLRLMEATRQWEGEPRLDNAMQRSAIGIDQTSQMVTRGLTGAMGSIQSE